LFSKQNEEDKNKGIEYYLEQINDPPNLKDFLDSFFEVNLFLHKNEIPD
jgi:hypothetical protein